MAPVTIKERTESFLLITPNRLSLFTTDMPLDSHPRENFVQHPIFAQEKEERKKKHSKGKNAKSQKKDHDKSPRPPTVELA